MIKNMVCIIFMMFALGVSAQHKEEITPYVNYIEHNELPTASQYIVSKFKDYDIVVLCERIHTEVTQYDMILEVLRTPWFSENVGVIFTEIGWQKMNPELNEFLKGKDLPEEEMHKNICKFQRNAQAYLSLY